jgi:hypothetical protein
MAGELVPHTLPDGRTLMVPSYLAKMQPAMQPSAPFAGGFTPKVVPVNPGAEWTSVVPDGAAPPPPRPPEVRLPTRDEALAEQRKATLPASTVEPPKLVNVSKASAPTQTKAPGTDAAGSIPDAIKAIGEEVANRRSGPGRPGGLAVSTVKQERQPGIDLLPEQKWRYGLEQRPDLGQEVDPDAVQPTWGNAEPVMRERKTALERGAERGGERARQQFEAQEQMRSEESVAQKDALVQQSQLLDQQLGTIADRRLRIANLQAVADQRAQEANSLEPRTREQIWQDKGAPAMVMATIGMAFGAYGASLGHHGNWAMDNINQILDSAVNDERAKWERRQRIGANAQNDLARAMAIYGDLDAAELDSRNRKLANVLAMTQRQLNDKSLDASAKARGEAFYQQAYDQYLDGVRKMRDLAHGVVTKEEVNLANRPATGGGRPPTRLEMLEAMAKGTEAWDKITHRPKSGEAAKGAVILPDGSTAYASSEQEAGKVQNIIRASDEVKQYLGRLKQLTTDASDRVLTSNERAEAETIKNALVPKLHDAMGVSTFRKDVAELMEKMIGDPDHFFRNPNSTARLNELNREMDQNTQSQLKYLRREPVASGSTETAAAPAAPGFKEEGAD